MRDLIARINEASLPLFTLTLREQGDRSVLLMHWRELVPGGLNAAVLEVLNTKMAGLDADEASLKVAHTLILETMTGAVECGQLAHSRFLSRWDWVEAEEDEASVA